MDPGCSSSLGWISEAGMEADMGNHHSMFTMTSHAIVSIESEKTTNVRHAAQSLDTVRVSIACGGTRSLETVNLLSESSVIASLAIESPEAGILMMRSLGTSSPPLAQVRGVSTALLTQATAAIWSNATANLATASPAIATYIVIMRGARRASRATGSSHRREERPALSLRHCPARVQ